MSALPTFFDNEQPLNIEHLQETGAIAGVINAGCVCYGLSVNDPGVGVVIGGVVEGDIQTSGLVIITAGAQVFGSIRAGALWCEGEIGSYRTTSGKRGQPTIIEVGDLQVGENGSIHVDRTHYVRLSVHPKNRGLQTALLPLAAGTGAPAPSAANA